MKIGQLEKTPHPTAIGEPKASTVPTSIGAKPLTASVQVALSSTLSQLAGNVSDGAFDSIKVQRISDAIRDGKFQINPGAIADKLIANAQELMGHDKPR